MFCCTLLYVHSSIAIILMGKRELIALLNLSSWCLVMVERLFLAVPRGCLQFVIVVFPDHTHLLFLTPPPRKWVNITGNISENEWNSYNTMTKNIKEVKLQEFQFKVNNHILVTKSFLPKIKKIDNDRCSFYNQESETIMHVLFLCNKVKEFWVALQNWLRVQANIEVELTAKIFCF